jgi:hypothetical protein
MFRRTHWKISSSHPLYAKTNRLPNDSKQNGKNWWRILMHPYYWLTDRKN